MGVLKKLFKGVKKVFKKIGKAIKRSFKAFGKFMGKIGFAGQLAMMFLFPAGIGGLFTKGLNTLGTKLAAVSGDKLLGAAAQKLGNVLVKASNFATKARSGFSSLTEGIKECGKTALNKGTSPLGLDIPGAAKNFFKPSYTEGGSFMGVPTPPQLEETAFSRTQAAFAETGELARSFKEGSFEVSTSTSLKDLSNKLGISQANLKQLNPDLTFADGMIDASGGPVSINLKPSSAVAPNISSSEVSKTDQVATFSKAIEEGSGATLGKDPSEGFMEYIGARDVGQQQFQAATESTVTVDPTKSENYAEGFMDYIGADKKIQTDRKFKDIVPRVKTVQELAEEKLSEDNWFKTQLTEGFDKTVEQFDEFKKNLMPSEVGFFKAGKTAAKVIAPFLPEEEPSEFAGGYAKPPVDVHSGFDYQAGYTPPQPVFDVTAGSGGMYGGDPFLRDFFQRYALYDQNQANQFFPALGGRP